MRFTDIFIRRPVLATVISLLILLLGLRAVFNLPVREYPKTETSVITITTSYPGASAQLMQGFVTTPIQRAIASADGIDYITATSTQGTSTITANIRLNFDPNVAMTQIMAKVNQVRNQLPASAESPVITQSTGSRTALMYLSFWSEQMSAEQVTDYLNRVVVPKLESVSGVAQAEVIGGHSFAMRVWLEPDRLAAHNLTPADIVAKLQANNYLASVGKTKGNEVGIDISANTDLHNADEFRQMVVAQDNGTLVRLGDVAKVDLGSETYDSSVVFNGQRATFIGVQATPTANPLTVISDVKKIFPSVQAQMPSALNSKIVYDATQYIRDSIKEVLQTILEALVIVMVVIYLFLGNFRAVLIPAVTIPLSIIGAAFLMLLMGYSINLLTLLSMVLAIGLVVDDAIIVVENVHRHIEDGESPFEAALHGARELGGPVIVMTLTLAAVYAPIGFLGGLTGALFTEFAYSLAGAVLISGVVALTLSPMMSSKLLQGGERENRFEHFLEHLFEGLKRRYQNLLHGSLNYRPVTYVMAVVILGSIYFLYGTAKHELAPVEDQGVLFISANAPKDATLPYVEKYTHEFEKIFDSFPEKDRYFMINGRGEVDNVIAGFIMKPWSERTRSQSQVKPILQRELAGVAGLKSVVFPLPTLPGGGQGLPVQFVITSTGDPRLLYDVSQQLLQAAQTSGKFIFVDSDLKYQNPQIHIKIDRAKAGELGISMRDIGSSLSAMLGGGYINYFNLAGRSYKVIPQVPDAARATPEMLDNYRIRTASGTLVPLSTVASLSKTVEPNKLNQFQQLNSATISGVMMPGQSIGEGLTFLRDKAKQLLPAGFGYDYAGESRQFIQEGSALAVTFVFSLIIIFLVLSAQFESFRDPIIVLISVPMAISGALIFISLGLSTVNIYTQIGLITLIGLISKHGILIVQFANDLQHQGRQKREAVEQAAAIRLRPILMTTAAMATGVVPLLIAAGPGAVSRFDIGLTIFTGILIGTMFTLFVVPAIYMLIAKDHSKDRVQGA
ncbi:MAG: efflux RND transporter permease subunit [Gammaproteobacteria bacterium]